MGGAENLLVGLTEGQRQLGHEVTVMPLICPDYTPVRERIEKNGVTVLPFKVKGRYYDPSLILKVAKVIKNYDIIHVHLFPSLYWVAFANKINCHKVPLVYTEHSTSNRRRNNKLLHCVDSFIYQNGYKMIIACAEKALETYKMAFPSVNHTCFINNGVNTRVFKEAAPYTKRELLDINEDSFVVTMVARFMSMKRQDTIVESMTKLPDNVHAVFVGGEASDEGAIRIQKLANDLGVSNRIHFLYIRNDVPRILKTSDVIVMASDHEGLSLSSIEGMAAGKPFVATDVNGLREVVGGAGVLFENKNAEMLADIISHLSTDKKYYGDVSTKCLERAQEYDLKKMVDSYMEVYRNVIN